MTIKAFPSGPLETNSYLIDCEITRKAVLIDASPASFEKVALCLQSEGLTLSALLLTHSHWDHIGDAARFKEQFNMPIYIHPLDRGNLEAPGVDRLPCWITIDEVKPDHLVAEGDVISIGKLAFEVIHTPGHTPGGVCFYLSKENALFSGDTLFCGSIGNLSLPTAQPELMWKSLNKLSNLPGATRVFPGHGAATSIAAEAWLVDAEAYFGS